MASKAGVEVQLHLYESKQASVVTEMRGVHYRKLKAAILETLAPPSVRPCLVLLVIITSDVCCLCVALLPQVCQGCTLTYFLCS